MWESQGNGLEIDDGFGHPLSMTLEDLCSFFYFIFSLIFPQILNIILCTAIYIFYLIWFLLGCYNVGCAFIDSTKHYELTIHTCSCFI